MTDDIKIGDTVYIKDEVVRECQKMYPAPLLSEKMERYQVWAKQVALSKGIAFTVIDIFPTYSLYCLSRLDNTFGDSFANWQGEEVSFYPFFRKDLTIEKNLIPLDKINAAFLV